MGGYNIISFAFLFHNQLDYEKKYINGKYFILMKKKKLFRLITISENFNIKIIYVHTTIFFKI